MAIIQETYVCKNGVILIHTYSDKGNYIKQVETGNLYTNTYDLPNRYTYVETDEKIEEDKD